ERRPNRPELSGMANSLFDLREMRPKSLRSQVQFGLSLAVRLRVNEEPSLVPFERQILSCTGNQRQPLPSLAPFGQTTRPRHWQSSAYLWPNYEAALA